MLVHTWTNVIHTHTDILDNIKPSLRKEPGQIIIHAGKNDLTSDHNYLNNVKKL